MRIKQRVPYSSSKRLPCFIALTLALVTILLLNGTLQHDADYTFLLNEQSDTTAGIRRVASAPETCLLPGMKIVPVRNKTSILFKMAVFNHSEVVSNTISRQGFWEIASPQEMAALAHDRDSTNNGDTSWPPVGGKHFIDIGANIGYYSLLFAHAGYQVTAIEPLPQNAQVLKASMCLNPQFPIKLLQVALSDTLSGHSCYLIARVSQRKQYLTNAVPQLYCADSAQCKQDDFICQVVPVTTLDTLLQTGALPLTDVAAVKMDVEQHEAQVLKGGKEFLKKVQPKFIQFEHKTGDQQVPEILKNAGYKIGSKRGHDGNTVARFVGEFETKS